MTKTYDVLNVALILFIILLNIATLITGNFKVILFEIILLIAYHTYSYFYFKSKSFLHIKEGISGHTDNCNELNHYIEKLKGSYININSYNYGTGNLVDESLYNFERKHWSKIIKSSQVHNCSSIVCKNASNQPIKYLCKYFDIERNEESLSKFEQVLNDFTSVEQGKDLIKRERESILSRITKSIPSLIMVLSKNRLTKKLGFEKVDISDSYIPTFTFQYVSAGGNSSSRVDINLNIENLNDLISYLNDVIKWRKSVAGQRALVTSKLREMIKERDNYQCRSCSIGIVDEPNLLLEIDHKIPLSKGGKTTINNLQTLCWKCNRAKGSKILD